MKRHVNKKIAPVVVAGVAAAAVAVPLALDDPPARAQDGELGTPSEQVLPADPNALEDQAPEAPTEEGSAAGGAIGDTDNVAVSNRLSAARVVTSNTNDDEENFVEFRFTDEIEDLEEENAGRFKLAGPDIETAIAAQTLRLVEGDDRRVLAGFDTQEDVRRFTIGMVEGGAVENDEDEGNVADSVTLDGSRISGGRGLTSGPDLLAVRASNTLNRVEYLFDEELEEDGSDAGGAQAPESSAEDPDTGASGAEGTEDLEQGATESEDSSEAEVGGSGDPSSFGYYTARGEARTASEVVSIEGRRVIVEFDEDADQVDEAERKFVRSGAVTDRSGIANPPRSIGGRTVNPDLVDATATAADTQYDFRFDEEITDVSPESFVLFTDSGERYEGQSYSKEGRRVRVSYDRQLEDFSDSIVLATVEADGAAANDREGDDGQKTTTGSVPVGSSGTRDGRTTGPDLRDVEFDERGERLTLTFDEAVEDEEEFDAARIYLATSDDQLIETDRIIEVDGRRVFVQADENDLEAAEGVTLDAGAVADHEGNPNPVITMAEGSRSSDLDDSRSDRLKTPFERARR